MLRRDRTIAALSAIAMFFGPHVDPAPTASAQDVSLGGFIPYVGIGLTDYFKDGGLDATFFISDPEFFQVGSPLTGGSPFHDVALLDTGAATHILTLEASGFNGFDILGNNFGGTNVQPIGGATGIIDLAINDPLSIFAAGLADRTSAGNTLLMNTNAFRGQSSFATLSAPDEWDLPNILGLPMAAHHAIHIQNSNPQIFELGGRTMRTPQVDFIDLGTGGDMGILRRTDLRLRPGVGFITGPLYVQNLDILGGGLNFEFHENPLSPSVLENAAIFVEVDFANGQHALEDKELLFDTGADLTVISELTAKRLGFDAVLDTPDFTLEVEGSGGISTGIPGFYLDELNIDTVGGSFTMQNVPVAVLDVTNPNDPGNTIDGIIGMHLFNGRDLVIDANASIGAGGSGPSVYISDPVTQSHSWSNPAASGSWTDAANWTADESPDNLWVAHVSNISGSEQTAVVEFDSVVFQTIVAGPTATMEVAIDPGAKLTSFGETRIDAGGEIHLHDGMLDAQFVNIDGGKLSGAGNIFVGAGPIGGAVRLLSGRLEPGDPIGTLDIVGDVSNVGGILAFDLAGTEGGTTHDVISVDRFAFLGGTLEVNLDNGYVPSVGNMFTLINAGEGVAGEFQALDLPPGFLWNIDYLENSVVLEITGLGSIAGDFNANGTVDATDLGMWEAGYAPNDGYQGDDLLDWQRSFGQGPALSSVPEPTAGSLALISLLCAARVRRQKLPALPRVALRRG